MPQKILSEPDSLTESYANEARLGNRIYDDRNECYEQYINVVEIATRMQERNDLLIKALEKIKAERYTRQQVQEMTDKQYRKFQKDIIKLQRSIKRNKTLVWLLAGYGAAATAVAAVFIATK